MSVIVDKNPYFSDVFFKKDGVVKIFQTIAEKSMLTQSQFKELYSLDRFSLVSWDASSEFNSLKDEDFYSWEKCLERLDVSNSGFLSRYLRTTWVLSEIPDIFHPDLDRLFVANDALLKLNAFMDQSNSSESLIKEATDLKGFLLSSASNVLDSRHDVVFIGSVGVGKSTAICNLFDLLVPMEVLEADRLKKINRLAAKLKPGEVLKEPRPICLADRAMLETGAGRTTICEVEIIPSDFFQIRSHPMSLADFSEILKDFCSVLWAAFHKTSIHADLKGNLSISYEHERAIRNMANLSKPGSIKRNGVRVSQPDPIDKLIQKAMGEKHLFDLIMERIDYNGRQRSKITFNKMKEDKDPFIWVSEQFRKLNNGKMEGFFIPSMVEIFVDLKLKKSSFFSYRIVDTKGLDDVVSRSDLDRRIRDKNSIVVLCTRYSDAPDTAIMNFIRHVDQIVLGEVDPERFSILSLPRFNESLQTKNDDGEGVSDSEEGYLIKQDQISNKLVSSGYGELPIHFFNSESDSSEEMMLFVKERISLVRASLLKTLDKSIESSLSLMSDPDRQSFIELAEATRDSVRPFFAGKISLPFKNDLAFVFQRQLERMASSQTHASRLYACLRRSGCYDFCDFYKGISEDIFSEISPFLKVQMNKSSDFFGVMRASAENEKVDAVLARCQTLYEKAVLNFHQGAVDNLISLYEEAFLKDAMWEKSLLEWGRGSGFKIRVMDILTPHIESKNRLHLYVADCLEICWERFVVNPLLDYLKTGYSEGFSYKEDFYPSRNFLRKQNISLAS